MTLWSNLNRMRYRTTPLKRKTVNRGHISPEVCLHRQDFAQVEIELAARLDQCYSTGALLLLGSLLVVCDSRSELLRDGFNSRKLSLKAVARLQLIMTQTEPTLRQSVLHASSSAHLGLHLRRPMKRIRRSESSVSPPSDTASQGE